MSHKRALVVDDSRSARVALQKLLEAHGLNVAFAESGEAALEFLEHEYVDVIFMDHTMPGMDGLEAVSAIKSDPRTATIPVMMYTAKEGEVYLSQARALGAVGVLPKQVQPGVLEQMLRKLGLLNSDAEGHADGPDDHDRPAVRRALDDLDREYDQRAEAASIKALVTRLLEEQHVRLRADILSSQRDFARRVAAEIANEQRSRAASEPPTAPEPRDSRWPVAAVLLLAVPLLVLAGLLWQVSAERDAAQAEVHRLVAAAEAEQDAIASRTLALQSDAGAARALMESRRGTVIQALEWALNQRSEAPFEGPAFDDARGAELQQLLDRLNALGFRGIVRLEAHLGEFCLVTDAVGRYRLADPDQPPDECLMVGHPLEVSTFAADHQSVGFQDLLADAVRAHAPDITIEVVAHDRAGSVPLVAMPSNVASAGAWNRIAQLNHRIEFSLIPTRS